MAIEIQKLTNGNVYIDGISHFGSFEEITLPEIKAIMQEHKALGMIGKMEFPAGFDKLEMKIKWNGPYNSALIASADFYTSKNLMIRGNRETYTAAGGRTLQEPVLCFVQGTFKKFPGLALKQMDNVEAESELAVVSYHLEIGGVEIVHLDFAAHVYRVNGVDQLAAYRKNLGI